MRLICDQKGLGTAMGVDCLIVGIGEPRTVELRVESCELGVLLQIPVLYKSYGYAQHFNINRIA